MSGSWGSHSLMSQVAPASGVNSLTTGLGSKSGCSMLSRPWRRSTGASERRGQALLGLVRAGLDPDAAPVRRP